ncbi:MAG: sigma-70 family RNA polymerase sigma factor [Thiohalocapsa sp.]|jgi:RNA polymerase sigma-70 factor (ECF subfamily)|uniref:sigma-70 family RNA polymerase sigma factor n=1 Tax=Thiohalocapsa sp. TaxID=2497641 RepID=UPI0025CD04BD|nr:sigma-70 family RNA polymerase sigma factor [Thiohalocapsa sp.]
MSSSAVDIAADQAIDFEQLARVHWPALYNYARRLSGDVHIAEDLVQESLLRAWRSRKGLRNPAAALGWLKTIVRRENARRFERAQPRETCIPAEEVSAGHQTYDTSTEAFALRRAIEALPVEYCEPLVLQVLYGLSQQEIADRLGLSSAGVGTRLFRARRKLRELLGER